jgi:hypothetical protein
MELIDFKSAAITLAVLLTSWLLLMWPVSAAESVIIPVDFNTESNESFTVAVLGESNCVSATLPVSACAPGISFNCTAGNNGVCGWVNAQGMQVGTQQDPATADQAIFIVTNTGTATLDLDFAARDDIYVVDNCLNMTYTTEQEASCVTTDYGDDNFTGQVKTTDITIDSSFTAAETQHCVWLFGNFSSCSADIDSTEIWFNSTVV